jgi:hypothetical protein
MTAPTAHRLNYFANPVAAAKGALLRPTAHSSGVLLQNGDSRRKSKIPITSTPRSILDDKLLSTFQGEHPCSSYGNHKPPKWG